jgi:hypothetical protein
LVTLKIALLAPMPSASDNIATVVNPVFLNNIRAPKHKSCHRIPIVYLITSGPGLFGHDDETIFDSAEFSQPAHFK